jgi:hypothetical protein
MQRDDVQADGKATEEDRLKRKKLGKMKHMKSEEKRMSESLLKGKGELLLVLFGLVNLIVLIDRFPLLVSVTPRVPLLLASSVVVLAIVRLIGDRVRSGEVGGG